MSISLHFPGLAQKYRQTQNRRKSTHRRVTSESARFLAANTYTVFQWCDAIWVFLSTLLLFRLVFDVFPAGSSYKNTGQTQLSTQTNTSLDQYPPLSIFFTPLPKLHHRMVIIKLCHYSTEVIWLLWHCERMGVFTSIYITWQWYETSQWDSSGRFCLCFLSLDHKPDHCKTERRSRRILVRKDVQKKMW